MKISREEYGEYLQSEDWWERRNLVMERAAGRCEGCRKAEPVDVHHLTYEHVTHEFLFELVAQTMAADPVEPPESVEARVLRSLAAQHFEQGRVSYAAELTRQADALSPLERADVPEAEHGAAA